TGSYEIDLPNGGDAVIENNVVEKGAGAQNSRFIAFGEEGNLHAGSSLSVTRNSLINDYGHWATAIWNATAVEASVTANTAYGLTDSQLVSGPVMSSGSNTLLPLSSEPAPDTSAPYLPVLPFSFACFAAGTRLLTAEGEVPVEALRVGQLVVGLTPGEGGKRALRPIRWIGHRHIDISRHADPGAVRPIRIRSGAFADGVPARDLLMSPDHAILVDGLLIPVRLLQNGASILSDNRITAVRYFHVELDRHAILLAEGLAAESYLDTGNRGAFENADAPLLLHPDFLTDTGRTRSTQDDAQAWRETLSCAPFAADAMRVEPVWRRLAVRATLLGYRLAELATTSDPGFRLLVDRRPHWPVARQDGRYVFVLPRPVPSVRLVSRAAAPCTLTPWIEDRRRLGVAVGRMILVSAQGVTLEIPVDHPTLTDGWWMVERDHALLWRWTAGSAVLPLPGGIAILQIGLVGGALYPLAEQTEVAAARPMVA
ncbi:MAG TPA: Hint domain-containing protein, partial [Rhodopila sp.]